MKIMIVGIIFYAAGFATAHYWEADREKHVSEDYASAKQRWAEVFAEDKKDEAILKKIDAARDKISDCLGIPRQLDSDPLNLDTPTPTP
jgi:hypothetical protein